MSSNTPENEYQNKTIIEREDKAFVESEIKRRETTDDVIDDNEITIRDLKDMTIIEFDGTAVEQKRETVVGSEISSFRNYPILEQFPAIGGEADIYLIKQEDKDVILKLYRYGMDPKAEVLKKAKELSCKFPEHIIEIYEYGYDDKTKKWYEIQEHAKCGSLGDYINAGFRKKELKTITEEIVEGLKVLNDNNLLHLDLKPSNILVRSEEPLDLIFTDFGIASILDPELSRKMTKIKGTPLYWSPESFTGVVGKEADYWSLGMIILEMLAGKHPFNGLDTKVIMYTLSTKGVGIPNDIPEEYQLLLKGLLTREPDKRWSYAEVRRWLNGEKDIRVYFSEVENKKGEYEKPYKFHDKEYFSLKKLVAAFVESEDSWNDAIAHINRGYITKWLENNEEYDGSVRIEKIREDLAGDNDLILLRIIYTFNRELPFVFQGKLITIQNLHLYAGKVLRKEHSKLFNGGKAVVDALVNGALLEYYRKYLRLTSKEMDDLYNLLVALNKTMPSEKEYTDKLTKIFKVLDFMLSIDKYILPCDITEIPYEKLDFIIENLDLFMTKEEYDELINLYIIPEELRSALIKGYSSQYIEKVKKLLLLHKNDLVLTKEEFEILKNEYFIPFLSSDSNYLKGKTITDYEFLIRMVRANQKNNSLFTENEYEDLMTNYMLPEELKKDLRSDEQLKYEKAVEFIKSYQKDNYLLSKHEYEELISKYLIPEELKKQLCSVNTRTYEGALKYLRKFQNNNLLITSEEFNNLTTNYIIPEELKNRLTGEKTILYETGAEWLRSLVKKNILIRKEKYEQLLNNYSLPEQVKKNMVSNEYEEYENVCNFLNELETGNLLLKNEDYEDLTHNYILPSEFQKDLLSGWKTLYIDALKLLKKLKEIDHLITIEEYKKLKKKYIIPKDIKNGLLSGGCQVFS